MRLVSLFVQAGLLLSVVIFVLLNKASVTLNYGFGQWVTALPWVMLLMFSVGLVLGVLSMFVCYWRASRKITALEKQCRSLRNN